MRVLTPALIAGALLLSACGTTEQAAPSTTATSGGGPVSVTDSRGKEIKLDSPARRVVALEWGEAEMVVSLGVMPVGAAETADYAKWDSVAPLDSSVKDLGTRAEPSVDAIVALDPDLVIVAAARDTTLVTQLEQYVPVLVTKAGTEGGNLDRTRADFKVIAQALGKTAEAETVLSEMDKALADGRQAVEAAGKAGTPVFIADGWMAGSTVSIRPFGKGSLVSDAAEAVGLVNAWTGEVDAQWGLGQTDVEGLTALTDPRTAMFYSASEEDVFTTGLGSNPVWQRLPFVASGEVTRFEPGTWTFGGPRSVVHIAEQVVKAITS
ncbi:ABC transporter substrate-binding protein [Saccharothrix coeruleofusca]|uniref:ABC transporter substrate-binding protein n=1 Tax=Saccharothrix coeruleofusca TaxID=33919 RepID=A0A918EBS7_9PSEU|nr:iron-siderophore ABC transporter substrate-binding protein [Saccharothrix coeruleofusca]GGP44447.1 ABC transporter substrate-binding protein [Saccharothrix coeruleofusca]